MHSRALSPWRALLGEAFRAHQADVLCLLYTQLAAKAGVTDAGHDHFYKVQAEAPALVACHEHLGKHQRLCKV